MARKNSSIILSFCLVLLVACAPPDRPPQTQPAVRSCSLLLANVNVVDVLDAVIREDQDVCIDSSKITAITDNATVTFDSETVVSASGKYLIPGLHDMHVHFRGGQDSVEENRDLLTLYLAHGITGVYDMGSDISDELVSWRAAIEAGRLVGPNLYLTGPKVDGPEPWFAGSLVVERLSDAESAIDDLTELGVNGVKIMGGTLSVDAFWFVLDVAKARGLQSIAHLPLSVSAITAAERGLDGIAHSGAIVFDGVPTANEIRSRLDANEITRPEALAAFVSGFDRPTMQRVLERFEQTTTALITTYYGSWLMAGGITDDQIEWEREQYRYAGPRIRESIETGRSRDQAFAKKHQERFKWMQSHLARVLSEIEDTDILLLVGTDSGPQNRIPGRVLHRELELLMAAGLTPSYVLRAATYNPAVFLDRLDRSGEVAVGKIADLVLLSSDPLADISNTQDIEGVIKSGTFFSRADIEILMKELESKYAN